MDRDRSAQIVPFTPELLPAVQRFSERYWTRPRSDAYYEWRYLRSQPFSRMFLALQDGECLGLLFALRKAYRIGGRPASCLEVFDWHCLPGLKGSGIGIRLMRAMMRQPEPVISVGGTADVLSTLPAMRWEQAGVARRYELPLSRDLLAARLERKTGLPVGATRGALGVFAAGVYRPRRRHAPAGGRVVPLGVPGDEVRALHAGETGYGLLQEPDPEVLRWLTDGRWSGRYGFLGFTLAGRLRGWAMTRVFATETGPEAAIVEIFAPRPDAGLYTWMVSEAATALTAARPRRIHARASCPILQAALHANHFRTVAPDNPIYVWPQGAWDRSGTLHITLDHSDGPLLPYESEAGAGAPGRAGVLFVESSPYPSYGGTKRVVVNLAGRLDRDRFAPSVLFYRDGPWVADLEAEGVRVARLDPREGTPGAVSAPVAPPRVKLGGAGLQVGDDGGVRRSTLRRVAFELRSWWWFLGRDVARARRLAPLVPAGTRLIHVNSSMTVGYAWYHVARRLGIPFLTHEHGVWKSRSAAYGVVAARAASVLCLTEERVEQLRRHLGGRVTADLLPNGIPVDRLAPATGREAVRAALGVDAGRTLIITAGHLQRWKGQTLAVEAAAVLVAHGLDFLWILCGEVIEPDYGAEVRSRIAAAGLDATVRMLGARGDLPDLFAASDLAAHTSIQPEPFGLVVLEAMLQRTPVVGPAEGAIPTLIRDGVDGRLVPPRDAAALAAALLELAGADERRRAMGEAARARVLESFDVNRQVRRLEAIYDRVLGRAPGAEVAG